MRFSRARLALGALALLLTAHAAAAERLQRSLRIDHQQRDYIVHLPDDDTVRAAAPAVILAFHPGYGTAAGFEASLALHALPGAEGFVVVYPDGFRRSWNAGDCCGPARSARLDDVGFAAAILDDVATLLPAGIAERNFAVGFSNGASMSQALACARPDRIAAIAIAGGTRDMGTGCAEGPAVSVFAVHGRLDGYSPYDGGTGAVAQAGARPAVEPNIDWWRRAGSCAEAAVPAELGTVPCRRYLGCDDGAEVLFCPVPDMGHWWPGAAPLTDRGEALFGAARPDLPGSSAALRFFADHRG